MSQTKSRDSAIARGVAFVRENARPLDVALLDHRLGACDRVGVVAQLAGFQNEDGGFAHGIEPDLPTPASTAIATSVGLRHLCEIDAQLSEPIVGRALLWLQSSFDPQAGVWPIINREVDLAPHAPWWTYSDQLSQTWNGFRYNPTAELLGAVYRCRDAVRPDLLNFAEKNLLRSLSSSPPTNAYDLKCVSRLLDAKGVPQQVRSALEEALINGVRSHEPGDPHLPFLEIALTPHSVVAMAFPDRIEPALSTLLETQQPDGSWRPFWDWSDVDAAAWKKAEAAWRGVLTRQAVETLIAYG